MSSRVAVVIAGITLLVSGHVLAGPSCADFDALLAKTYGFRPAKLSPAERQSKTAGLDRFWTEVKAKRAEWLPCLRSALRDPKRDRFFAFDGAALIFPRLRGQFDYAAFADIRAFSSNSIGLT